MKTFRILLITLLLMPLLFSCGKTEAVNPQLVGLVAGNYNFSYVWHQGKTYAIEATNLTGSASIEQKSGNSVKMTWNYKGGNNTKSGSYTGVSLTETTPGTIELHYSGKLLGTVTDGTLELITEDADGARLVLIGSR